MKLSRTLVVLGCGIALFAACKKTDDKKDDTTPATAPTIRQMLIGGKWQMIASTATASYMGKDTTVNVFATMKDCEKDDFATFADNGVVTKDENTNVCSGNPQTVGFPWALLNNDTKLALVDSNPDTFDLEISSSQMKLKLTTKNTSGNPLVYLHTYKNIK